MTNSRSGKSEEHNSQLGNTGLMNINGFPNSTYFQFLRFLYYLAKIHVRSPSCWQSSKDLCSALHFIALLILILFKFAYKRR